jgi:hypothetical protein
VRARHRANELTVRHADACKRAVQPSARSSRWRAAHAHAPMRATPGFSSSHSAAGTRSSTTVTGPCSSRRVQAARVSWQHASAPA